MRRFAAVLVLLSLVVPAFAKDDCPCGKEPILSFDSADPHKDLPNAWRKLSLVEGKDLVQVDERGKLSYSKHPAAELVVLRDGTVTLTFFPSLGGKPGKELRGKATKDELANLQKALERAAKGPLVQALPTGEVARGDQIALTTLGNKCPKHSIFQVFAGRGSYGKFQPRVEPVVAALDAIRARVAKEAPTTAAKKPS